MEKSLIVRLTENIGGWLTDAEAEFLYNAAKDGPGEGVIVEIGSWKGKSTVCLAKGSKDAKREKVYAIDPHLGETELVKQTDTFSEFKANIKATNVEDYVIPMKMKSEEAARKWEKKIRLLWIDGAHDYENVLKDFNLWEKHLVKGGIISFHDTLNFPGPKKVVREKIFYSDRFSQVGLIDNLVYAAKLPMLKSYDHLQKMKVHTLKRLICLGKRLPSPLRKVGKIILRKK